MHEFRVEKMSCGGCARRVTQAVQAIDQSAKVHVDLASKLVRVESSLDADRLGSAITGAGYPATCVANA